MTTTSGRARKGPFLFFSCLVLASFLQDHHVALALQFSSVASSPWRRRPQDSAWKQQKSNRISRLVIKDPFHQHLFQKYAKLRDHPHGLLQQQQQQHRRQRRNEQWQRLQQQEKQNEQEQTYDDTNNKFAAVETENEKSTTTSSSSSSSNRSSKTRTIPRTGRTSRYITPPRPRSSLFATTTRTKQSSRREKQHNRQRQHTSQPKRPTAAKLPAFLTPPPTADTNLATQTIATKTSTQTTAITKRLRKWAQTTLFPWLWRRQRQWHQKLLQMERQWYYVLAGWSTITQRKRLATVLRHWRPPRVASLPTVATRALLLLLMMVTTMSTLLLGAAPAVAATATTRLSTTNAPTRLPWKLLRRTLLWTLCSKLAYDWRAVRARQARDATSEWERYAQKPGARGRALMSLLLLQVAPLYGASRVLGIMTGNKNDNNNPPSTSPDTRIMQYAGHVLTQGLLQLGPLYCKMGQILSCRDEALPAPWIAALAKLQDQVPAQSGNAARKLALTAWEQGRKEQQQTNGAGAGSNSTTTAPPSFDDVFSEFDTTPLAAASLGQVHKAVLRETNETVAIKLQRPFLRQIYDQDLTLMTKIAKAVDRFGGSAGQVGGVEQSWEQIFLDAEAILYREIDYRDEAENGMRFCHDFGLDKGGQAMTPTATTTITDGSSGKATPLPSAASWLRAPYVYDKLSSELVLVMEFVPSIKITNTAKLDAANVTAAEREYLADCLGRSYLRQFCSHQFFSTDPHPGNLGCEILSSESGSKSPEQRVRLVFYDFGQAATLTQGQADGILDIIEAIVDLNVDKSIDAFGKMGVLKPNADLDKVRAKISENYKTGKVKANRKRLKKRGYAFGAKDDTTATSTTDNLPKQKDDDTDESAKVRDAEVMQYFTLPAEYAFVGRALAQMNGVGKALDAEFDFISSAAPWIYEIKGASQYLKQELSKRLEQWNPLQKYHLIPKFVDEKKKK